MGCYINPKDCTKEEFLRKKGLEILGPEWPSDDDYALICLVDNGVFTAAGICCSQWERDAFAVEDGRPKRWFMVKKSELAEFMGTTKFE